MSKKAIRQDLISKGIDPRTAIIGPDGLFMAPPAVVIPVREPDPEVVVANSYQAPVARPLRNALVMPKISKGKKTKVVNKETEDQPVVEKDSDY